MITMADVCELVEVYLVSCQVEVVQEAVEATGMIARGRSRRNAELPVVAEPASIVLY